MKNLFGWMLAALLALTVGVSCSDDDDLNEGAGIASPAWKAENQAVIEGETLDFEFTAEGRWTAVSSADWCEVKTPSGVAGESLLRLKVAKNNLAEARTATITVHVKGYAASASFVVKQAEGTTEQGDGKYRSVNEWVADYMKNFYLWNRPIENLFLDYSLSYDRFFTSILDGVAAQDDVNHDDGFWQGQKRMYYYSNLQSDAPVSRAPGQTQSGSGIYLLQATRLGTDYIGFAVMAVVPGTPADDAGLVRGDFITSVNGVEVTDANYKTLGQYVYDGSVEIAVSQVTWEDNGSTPVLSSKGNIQLGAASFTDPAIYMDKVVGIDGTEKKVGYLLYMGFNIDYDDELMAAFETSLAPVALSPVVMQAVALGVEQNQITTFLLPVQANNHPIYNPSLDYSVYLSQPFFFVLFQVLILLITVYTVGIEIKFRTANDWLTTAKGNIVTAVLGKLLPYTIIYILIGWLANYVMFGILHIPFQGSWWLMNIMTVLFIIATQALGLFLFSLFPAISLVISVVSMVGSLGATLSGVTFPVPNMYPLVRDASYLFPVRHFTEMMQTMLYGGGGFIHLWPSAVILCIFPLLALLLLPHLKRAIESHKYENIK